MKAKKAIQLKKKDSSEDSPCISSIGVNIPAQHSSFYDRFKHQLNPRSRVLISSLVADNYKEKFHHLLCWEEQEHDRLLAER